MAKKTGLKINLHPEVIAWLRREEARSGVSKTRLILAALVALRTRHGTERAILHPLATKIDNGEESWDGALHCLMSRAGQVVLDEHTDLGAAIRALLDESDETLQRIVRKPGSARPRRRSGSD